MLARNKKVVSLQRRNGRVVDRGGLENRCTAMYRGFESLFLRGKKGSEENRFLFLFYDVKLVNSRSDKTFV